MTVLHVCHRTSTPHKSGNTMKRKPHFDKAQTDNTFISISPSVPGRTILTNTTIDDDGDKVTLSM